MPFHTRFEWRISLISALDQPLTLLALITALQERKPVIHHSYQGLQYAAWEYVEILQMAGGKSAWRKWGYAEQ